MEKEKKMKTVLLRFLGTGILAELIDDDQEVIDSYYEMLDEFEDIEVLDEDWNVIQEIPVKAIGELLCYDNEDDEDFNKVTDWKDHICWYYEPKKENEDIARINLTVSEIVGEVKLTIPADETIDPKKIRPLSICWAFPGEEPEVCFGILYDGVEYPMVLDLDSEKIRYENTVWSSDPDDEDCWDDDEDCWDDDEDC